MVNCNPETVSTDYDTSDRLYFEPLTFEDVLAVYEHEASGGAEIGAVIVQFGGQTPLNLSLPLKAAGVPIIGTSPESIELAEEPQALSEAARRPGHSAAPSAHSPPASTKPASLERNASSILSSFAPRLCSAVVRWSSRMTTTRSVTT